MASAFRGHPIFSRVFRPTLSARPSARTSTATSIRCRSCERLRFGCRKLGDLVSCPRDCISGQVVRVAVCDLRRHDAGAIQFIFRPQRDFERCDLNAISGFGTAGVILGIGTGSQLNQFQVAIPEPGAFGLIAFGWIVASNRRSRRRARRGRVHHARC